MTNRETSIVSAVRPPNVVFILGDDWGWGDLGCFGHGQLRTPCLDRAAAEGTRYTQFYVASAVCSPSRAAFMTGCFPGAIGVHTIYAGPEQNRAHGVADFLDPGIPTLPRLLRERGYATAHFGKWHLGRGNGAPDPGAYGFDTHLSTHSSGPRWAGVGDVTEAGHTAATFQPRSSAAIVDSTIEFIQANRARPFYVQAWLLDPHAVLNPTAEQMAPYRHLSPKGVSYPGAPTVYYAVVTNADHHVGRLIDAIDALGLAEDTLIIFTGDNGPEDLVVANASHSAAGSPGPFRGRKRSLYEGGVRMPLIVRWQGHVPANRVDSDSVLSAVDFLPTLCGLAGAPTPRDTARDDSDGEDVSDALLGGGHRRERPLLWEWRFPIAGHPIHKSPRLAVRDGGWKLLLNPDRSRVELYDIPRDPMELHDRTGQHPEVVDRLATRALDWSSRLPAGPVSPLAGSNAYPWPG
jgi:N-acetylgalactosamine-6-sulfatase